jgi:integrase
MCLGGKNTMKRSDFVESGREGGRIAASRMTPKQRSERARKAALAKAKKAKARKGKAWKWKRKNCGCSIGTMTSKRRGCSVSANRSTKTEYWKPSIVPWRCAPHLWKGADALKLAEKESARLAQTRPAAPEMMVTLGDYFTRIYLPFAESKLRFATARNYGIMWGKHFASRPHITRKLLCDVRTSDVYAWLGEIVATDKTENGETLGAATVKRFKSLLSGIFTHAVNLGYLQTANPVQGAMLPAAAPPRETIAYSLEQIRAMIAALPDATSRVMVAVAAFTGLSRSEIRGLTWEAWQGDELHVLRSIVGGRVQDTKTRARKAPVPLLPSLAQVLAQYRAHGRNPLTGPIFRTANGTPLDPNNILRDRMQPAFKKARIAFWQGWHGLRRGLCE